MFTAEMGNELIILDMKPGKYFGIDRVGHRIWALLAKPMTIDQLCKQLSQEYNVDIDLCTKDTIVFLIRLHEHNLLHMDNACERV